MHCASSTFASALFLAAFAAFTGACVDGGEAGGARSAGGGGDAVLEVAEVKKPLKADHSPPMLAGDGGLDATSGSAPLVPFWSGSTFAAAVVAFLGCTFDAWSFAGFDG